ncbi:MAG: bifunctional diaminohydroxyphosphoribosylaminopyrimidine deaminase/5-amino-6-(5-phosphoribosylamino)uracil reductase RibD [Candidatus Eisenbacteria sp.]|nr:bifunctional diaminohydroxyphosphoribosylaminopyrimidine deaminase/5-amino-6-(5-phosphoribosylamino)uracil reductase RibD [Candidatus Eisenbacteria bacterium]
MAAEGCRRELDRTYMRLALKLARVGMGWTHPNPRVGAVAVRDGVILGVGAHLEFGGPHAEGALISAATTPDGLRGATLYVTLEPCAHEGKVAACAPAIVKAGISRVVAAMEDPDPLVQGRGFSVLREAGLQVDVGVMERAARILNAPFLWRHLRKRAFVTLKVAASLDGRIAAADGSSRWITHRRAREWVHCWRASCDAVLIGRGTFEADRPSLTARPSADPLKRWRARLMRDAGRTTGGDLGGGPWPHQPVRIVLDSRARMAQKEELLSVMQERRGGPWIVACGARAPGASRERLRRAGIRSWVLPEPHGGAGVDLQALTAGLAEEGMLDLLVEGGATLATELMRQNLVDRFRIFVSPLLLGGERSWAGELGCGSLAEGRKLIGLWTRRVGPDVLLQALSPDADSLLRGQLQRAGEGS